MTTQITSVNEMRPDGHHAADGPLAPGHSESAVAAYTLGSNPAERARLRQQSIDLNAHAVALLDHVSLASGGNALDLGCGPSGVLDLLAERVRPSGRVLGLDCNPAHVAMARAFARERGLTNVEVVEGDARSTGLPAEAFDLVHARLVLVNIPEPGEVVAEMARLVRPGGWVGGEEADGTAICHPASPAWNRLYEIFHAAYRQNGADLQIGRRLPTLFRAAGLVDVGVEVRADVYPAGHPRRTLFVDLVNSMRTRILEHGIASEQELDDVIQAVRGQLAAPDTLFISHLFVLAWGRKPPS